LVQILTVWHRPVHELNPAVSSRLSKIVDRALAKSRDDRFQAAADFLEALRRFKRRLTSSIPAPKPASRPEPKRIHVHEIADESTDDGTIVFARVQDSREVVVATKDAQGRYVPEDAPGSAPGSARFATAPSSARPASAPGSARPASAPGSARFASAPGSARPASAPGSARPASVPGSARPASVPGSARPASVPRPAAPLAPTSGPGPGSSPSPEEDATMVDPPSFTDDSVTMVRRDLPSRRDRG
ncbi:MAG TPA: hypothetical protein VLS89_17070, partial [Candidatus Nanopelagicales bacterium]|nr:hypothetical protein [Candidatus Nanopelagicales bacterium]